jgi:hypothetical protein
MKNIKKVDFSRAVAGKTVVSRDAFASFALATIQLFAGAER